MSKKSRFNKIKGNILDLQKILTDKNKSLTSLCLKNQQILCFHLFLLFNFIKTHQFVYPLYLSVCFNCECSLT